MRERREYLLEYLNFRLSDNPELYASVISRARQGGSTHGLSLKLEGLYENLIEAFRTDVKNASASSKTASACLRRTAATWATSEQCSKLSALLKKDRVMAYPNFEKEIDETRRRVLDYLKPFQRETVLHIDRLFSRGIRRVLVAERSGWERPSLPEV